MKGGCGFCAHMLAMIIKGYPLSLTSESRIETKLSETEHFGAGEKKVIVQC